MKRNHSKSIIANGDWSEGAQVNFLKAWSKQSGEKINGDCASFNVVTWAQY